MFLSNKQVSRRVSPERMLQKLQLTATYFTLKRANWASRKPDIIEFALVAVNNELSVNDL